MTSLLLPSSQFLQTRTQSNSQPLLLPRTPLFAPLPSLRPLRPKHLSISAAAPKKQSENVTAPTPATKKNSSVEEETEEEVEEDMLWIQEKALDLVEFTGSVTQAIPGPRVGSSKLPWMLAVPLAYAGVTFVTAFVKTVKKFSSPKAQRRKLVSDSIPSLSLSLSFVILTWTKELIQFWFCFLISSGESECYALQIYRWAVTERWNSA